MSDDARREAASQHAATCINRFRMTFDDFCTCWGADWEAGRATPAAPPTTGGDDADLVERLAALSHEQWSGWTRWMLDKWYESHPSGEAFVTRWKRQMETPYAELSEAEKESDRVEARKIMALLRDAAPRPDATGGRCGCPNCAVIGPRSLDMERLHHPSLEELLGDEFDRAMPPATAAEGEGSE